MAFLGGITWKHPDFENVVIHSIPLKIPHNPEELGLPKDMGFLGSPEYAEVVESFMPFINQEKFGQPDPMKTLQVAYRYKVKGNDKYKVKNFREAYKMYQCSWRLFQLVCKFYPQANNEIVLVLSNLSATCLQLKQSKDAVDYAEQCIQADKSFVKGYFRRAEAHKLLAVEMKTDTKEDRDTITKYLLYSMKDYVTCYEKMTDPKELASRVKQYAEAMKMCLALSCTKLLPEFHEEDQPVIVIHLFEYILTNFQNKFIGDLYDFMLFEKADLAMSGLARRHPCDCSALSLRSLIKKGLINMERLSALHKLHIVVRDSDIILALEDMHTENITFWYQLVDYRCEYADKYAEDHLTDVLDAALKTEKIPFIRCLIVEHDARPSKHACIKCLRLFRDEPRVRRAVLSRCSGSVRADMVVHCFIRNDEKLLDEVLESGRFEFKNVDLSKIMASTILMRSPECISIFLQNGAPANGTPIGVHPVTALLKSSHLSRPKQVEILILLIEQGADIKRMCCAYSDPMSPVHVATKLALETGFVGIVEATCRKFSFPSNGCLVDKNNCTPLHIAMQSEDVQTSLRLLEILSMYNISRGLKDDKGKRAQDYVLPTSDEARLRLVRYNVPEKKEMYPVVNDPSLDIDKIDVIDDKELDDHPMFKIVISEKKREDGDDDDDDKWKDPPKVEMIDLSKLPLEGGTKPACWGVDARHKDKWVGDWGRYLPADENSELRELVHYQSMCQQLKNVSQRYVEIKSFDNATHSYMQTINQYELLEKNYPDEDVRDEKGLMYLNLSHCLLKIKYYQDAATAAEEAVGLIPKNYKAHYRKALSNTLYAHASIESGHNCPDIQRRFQRAMTSYATAYNLMNDPRHVQFRSQLICDILRIGLKRGSTEYIPKFHKFDEPLIVTKIITNLVKHTIDKPIKKCAYVDAVLVKSRIPKSGFGAKYSCKASCVSLAELLPHPSIALLKALLSRGCVVTVPDLKAAADTYSEEHMEHVKLLTERFLSQGTKEDTTDVCNELLATDKLYFVPFFLPLGAKPSISTILDLKPFHELENPIAVYIAKACDPNMRTKILQSCLNAGTKYHVGLIMSSGRFLPNEIELSKSITSPALLKKPELVEELIDAGVSPLGSASGVSPMSALFSAKSINHSQLTRIGEILITHGASVNEIRLVFEEKMTPVHAATKLALETGNISFLNLVCSKTTFPLNGRVIDNHTQTPLHLALRAKYNEKSTQVCEVLSKYCIDPKVRDQWNRTAQEYCRTKTDKRIPYIRKAAKTMEEMNKRGSTVPLDQVGMVEEGAKKKKKKRKRSKKDKKEEGDLEEEFDDGSEKEDEEVVIKAPAKPAEPVLDISSLLERIMLLAAEYFNSKPLSGHTSFQMQISEEQSKEGDNGDEVSVCFRDELFPLPHVGRHRFKLRVEPTVDIDDQPWEIECTEKVLRFLKNEKYPVQVKNAAVERISFLATGRWIPLLSKPIRCIKESPFGDLFEAKLSANASIIWDVSIQFSAKCTTKDITTSASSSSSPLMHVFSEVIRVWDIVPDEEQKELSVQRISKSRDRGLKANIDLHLLPQFLPDSLKEKLSRHNLPKKYLLQSESESDSLPSNHTTLEHLRLHKFRPVSSIKDDEFNVITFYQFSSDLVSCMIGGGNSRRDFPFKEWPKEHDIIHLPHNKEAILLVGRSGTGKTTCCLYRLWYEFRNYWEQAGTIGAWYPHMPLVSPTCKMPITDVSSSSPAAKDRTDTGKVVSDAHTSAESELEHLHQVFITKNYVLCAQMKKRFYDMAASYPHLTYHLEYENVADPVDLESIHNMAFPLFLTSRQFLLLLDASLDTGMPFFPRNKDRTLAVKISSSDYDHENPDTLLDMEESDYEDEDFDDGDGANAPAMQPAFKSHTSVWLEVTASYFISDIWPKISNNRNNIDPLLVWMEIKSFIKGSAQAVGTKEGYLSETDYLTLGKKMASNFVGNRRDLYQIFLRYENYLQKKRSLNLFDECQFVHNIYQRLVSLKEDPPWSIHHFYIDEVQDFTQAELSAFIRSCREPNNMFLTGDTAQSIMRGISFRFSDLRSLFHYANETAPVKIEVPVIHNLTINFRSHSGILQLAASIIDLMKKFFPSSFDRLPEDQGMFPGPLPVFLQSCQVSDLALLLQSNKRTSSAIEFGAHQVIIVQSDEAKKALPDVLKAGIVLTVFESKGLEFDDVLLYNFFSDSPIDKEWRVVTSYADQYHMSKPSITFEGKPRPLEFDEQVHKSLNAELKYLYTAITRAKCNLWIYDSDKTRRLPIFDYWVRRKLIRVVRIGEKEEEDQVLFTATSTPDQWKQQGDYFRRKGLWEPAMKCYRKANAKLLEKEAEAYMFAQKAKQSRSPHETIGLFENAARAFLLCDYIQHNVKYLVNAAKCLKNSKRHLEAAKLFEKLGETELAKRSYIRAKDHTNIARIRESEGDYSGAVRVFVRATCRVQAIECAQMYEKKGHKLEADVSSFQLANQYAKFYVAKRDEANLTKVLSYIDDPIVRVAHLKKGKFYATALDEYLSSGKTKDSIRLILAQEMYNRGLEMAIKSRDTKLQSILHLHRATALVYHTKGSKASKYASTADIVESLGTLCSTTTDPPTTTKAKAKLLLGIIQEKQIACEEAMNMYKTAPMNDVVGYLESFNQLVRFRRTDVSIPLTVTQCLQASKISASIVASSAKSAPILKAALEFYHLSKLEGVYLLARSQDIWVGNLNAIASIKDNPVDENGMLRLEQSKVQKILSARFSGFVKDWADKSSLVKRIRDDLQLYIYHNELSNDQSVTVYHEGFPPQKTTEYIETVNAAMKVSNFISGSFDERKLSKLIPNIFAPNFSFCVPISKVNRIVVQKCQAIRDNLSQDVNYFLEDHRLFKPDVDELFDAWKCSCLICGVVEMERRLEEFAARNGPGSAEQEKNKVWLFIDRKGKPSYHYFFSYLLKAYRLIREKYQVIGSIKIIYNCFLAVVAKRPLLRDTISTINLMNIITTCSTALISLCSIENRDLALVVPCYYRYQCQLFDDLNLQDTNQYWLLTACIRQIQELRGERLSRLLLETNDLLNKFLLFITGQYSEYYNLLELVVKGDDLLCLTHTLVNLLVLVSNIRVLSDVNSLYLSECMDTIQTTVKVAIKEDVKLAPYLNDFLDKFSLIDSVYDTLSLAQILLSKSKYPSGMAQLHVAKSGNMDFKEVTLPAELNNIQLRIKQKTMPVVTPTATPTVAAVAAVSSVSSKPLQSNNASAKIPTSNKTQTDGTASVNTSSVSDGINGGGAIGGAVKPEPGIPAQTPNVPDQTTSQPHIPHVDPVLQTLQQQLMFILQQRQQLDQYRVLLNQQLVSLQQTPLDNLALYQQQLLQLRQQQYQANEAVQRLELQHQQINFKMLQHYNSMTMLSQPPAALLQKPQLPQPQAVTPALSQDFSLSQIQPTPSVPVGVTGSSHAPVVYSDFPDSNSQEHPGTNTSDSPVVKPSVSSGSNGAMTSVKKNVEDDTIDDEMEHLLVLSQSDFDVKPSAANFPCADNEDSELVDQHYCQVCGISFKSENTDAKVEEVSVFHNTNFETHSEHIRSKTHQDNIFSHNKFMSFKEQSYSEPRKQLDNLLDDTARFDSANLDRYVFSVRSKLQEFDQEIEEFKDAYKWRNAHSRMVAFVEEMASVTRQMMKIRAAESAKVAPTPTFSENLADMVFIDDEEDFGIDIDGVEEGIDARRRKKSAQRK